MKPAFELEWRVYIVNRLPFSVRYGRSLPVVHDKNCLFFIAKDVLTGLDKIAP